MKPTRPVALCSVVILSLAGCAFTPMGPTVHVLPQAGKPFEVFASESTYCKQYAESQVHDQADAANQRGLVEGIAGTALGAGLGAALGGGRGAAVGAASGAIAGTAVGGSTSMHEQRGIQQQYNDSYAQCMVAKGNTIDRPVVYTPPSTTIIYSQPQPTVVYTTPPPTVVYPAPPPY